MAYLLCLRDRYMVFSEMTWWDKVTSVVIAIQNALFVSLAVFQDTASTNVRMAIGQSEFYDHFGCHG